MLERLEMPRRHRRQRPRSPTAPTSSTAGGGDERQGPRRAPSEDRRRVIASLQEHRSHEYRHRRDRRSSTPPRTIAVVPADRWVAERKALLAREKELDPPAATRSPAQRRACRWERVAKDYVFDAPEGRRSLADLFEGRRQLLVQHFMLGPGWEQGCPSCSFMADHTDGMTVHLAHRDVTLAGRLSRAAGRHRALSPAHGLAVPAGSRRSGSDFNRDFHVSFDAGRSGRRRRSTTTTALTALSGSGSCPGVSVVLQGRRGRGLPHLLDLRPRRAR